MEWAGGIYPMPPSPPPYREARAMLGQYERYSSWLRSTAGGALFLMAVAIPPGVLALGVFVVRGDLATYAVGLISLCTAWLPPLGVEATALGAACASALGVARSIRPAGCDSLSEA